MTHVLPQPEPRLREVVRSLLLPISPDHEAESLEALTTALTVVEIDIPDQAEAVRQRVLEWKESGTPSETLVAWVDTLLQAGEHIGVSLPGSEYFSLHRNLRSRFALSFESASLLLGHVRLIRALAETEHMSASQIARLVATRDGRLRPSWQATQAILRVLKLEPTLTPDAVQNLLTLDRFLEEEQFGDSGLGESIDIVARAAEELGLGGDIQRVLHQLLPEGEAIWFPYLQMIHYQCSILEFFDHPPSWAYEFKPRGRTPKAVFDLYASLPGVSADNPFLNNAKSVDRIDRFWANTKDDHLAPALALAELFEHLDNLGYLARQELAAWLRRWLLRIVRLQTSPVVEIPEESATAFVSNVLRVVSLTETRTRGIIEQRVIDALITIIHPERDGWRWRGIGDSVNASNFSQKKLGDVDVQRANERIAIAYEVHAGILTDVYLDAHRASLERIIPYRAQEWSYIAELSEWELKVVFVAHELRADLPTSIHAPGLRVSFEFRSFDALIAAQGVGPEMAAAFRSHVNARLNQRSTPDVVRRRFLDLGEVQ